MSICFAALRAVVGRSEVPSPHFFLSAELHPLYLADLVNAQPVSRISLLADRARVRTGARPVRVGFPCELDVPVSYPCDYWHRWRSLHPHSTIPVRGYRSARWVKQTKPGFHCAVTHEVEAPPLSSPCVPD